MNNELYHFGVKGMRWGVRNAETRARYRRDGKTNGSSSSRKSRIKRAAAASAAVVGAGAGAYTIAKNNNPVFKANGFNKNAAEARRQMFIDATTPTIKRGKDKEKVSPSQQIVSDTNKAVSGFRNIANRINASERESARASIREEARHMSEQDLNRAINRMQTEKRYTELKYDDLGLGKGRADSILETTGDLLSIAGAGLSAYMAWKMIHG